MRRGFALAAWLFAASPGVAGAASIVWSGAAGGVWSTGANWVGGSPPGSADTATFNGASVPCSITSAVSVGAISVSVNVTITVSSGVTVTTSGDFTQSNGTFNSSDGAVTIGGNFNLSSGTFKATSGLLKIAGAFNKTGGTFNANGGRVMLSSTSSQTFATNGATFNNLFVNDGLVGYWKLDDAGSTVTDWSGYGNNGTRSASGATWQSSVPSAMAFTDSASLALDGSAGYATIAASNLPALNGSLTVSFWAYWASVSGTAATGQNMVVLTDGSTFDQIGLWHDQTLSMWNNGGTNMLSASSTPSSGWHHIAYTFDGTTRKFYLDGGTPTTSTTATYGGTPTTVYFGTYDGTHELFNGKLDDVRVYNRALSASEIGALAAGDQPGTSLAVQTMTGSPVVSGDLTIASGTLAAGSNNLTVGGSWWNYGVFSGTGTITFNGTGTGNSILTAGKMPGSLTISGTGSWAIADGSAIALALTGSYTQSAGTFTSTSGLLKIGGAFNKTGGTFTHNNGQVMLAATSSQTFATNGATFYNLTVNDGLAGYWKLDDASGSSAADGSGYGNAGSVKNSPTWATSSLPSLSFNDPSALTLNGSTQYVDVTTAVTPTNAAFTACAWVKFAVVSGFESMASINGANVPAFTLYRDTGGKFAFDMRSADNTGATLYQVLGATAPTTGTWYHTCGVYDGSQIHLYVNGTQEGTPVSVGSTWTPSGHTYIGGSIWAGSIGNYLNGTVDDVRIYSRALSDTEIGSLALGYTPASAVATQTMSGSPVVANDLVIASGKLAAGSNGISVAGNWWNYGGAFSGTGTVTFNGSATGKSILSGSQPFGGITVSGTGGWTLADRLLVPTGTLAVNAGTLTGASYPIEVGSLTRSGGTLSASSATLVVTGTSSPTIAGGTYAALRVEDPTESNLVGYWKLDELAGTNVRDWSGSGLTGTATGSPLWSTSVPGAVTFTDPGSLKLTGSNYVDVTGPVTASNAALTACAWVNLTSASGYQTFVSVDGTNISGFYLQLSGVTGKFDFAIRSADSTSSTLYEADSTTTPSTGTWYHVCGVYTGSVARVYVNGSQQGSDVTVSSSWNATGDTILGAGKWSGARVDYVSGTIDDVRVYNAALTSTQIAALAAGRYPGTGGTATATLAGATTVSGAFALDSGSLSTSTYNLTAANATSTLATVSAGTLTIGSGTVSLKGGATFRSSGTLTMATSGGTLAMGSGTTLTIDGTLNASSTGATIKSVSGTYTFTVGSTASATPTLNISGLAVQNTSGGMAIGATTAAAPIFTRFDNIAFSNGSGAQLLSIKAASLYLSSSGCSFDGGVPATTTKSVLLAGNGTSDGDTRVVFGGATCTSDAASCQATKSDDDSGNDGVGDNPSTNGAVVQFVRSVANDTAGSIIGFPTAAFDWNTFSYYSTYVAFHDASGGNTDVVYVRDESGNPQYSWTVPSSGETITGVPQWTTIGSTHYLFVATDAGKVYRLVDNVASKTLTLDTGSAWSTNPFNCSCTISTPLALDSSNVYFGSTTSSKNFWMVGISNETNPTPVSISSAVTNTALTITTVGGTSYAFMGITGYMLKLSTASDSLIASNSSPGSASVKGRIIVGYNKSGTQRVYAGDDGGTMWALDPGSGFATANGLWHYASGSAINGSPYYDHDTDTIQYGTQGGTIVVLNASSGAVLNSAYPYTPSGGGSGDPITAAPLYYGGILVVGSTNGKLYFLDRNTGTGVSVVKQYDFGPGESVSGIGYDPNQSRFMVSTAKTSALDGRVYFFDSVSDPTPSSL
jgi:hypothetical protein